jgi:cell division septal protein FtsQ
MWGKSKKFKKTYYVPKRRGNPLFRQANRPSHYRSGVDWLTRLYASLFFVILASLVYLFFYSPLFAVSAFEATGAEKLSADDITGLARSQSALSRWLIFRQNNIFMFDAGKLAADLRAKYVFQDLAVNKKIFGKKINIVFTEKTYSLVWQEGGKYYFINRDGTIVTEIDPLQLTGNKYPLIENEAGPAADPDRKISGQEEKIGFIMSLGTRLAAIEPKIEVIRYAIRNSEDSTVRVIASGTPALLFNAKENLDTQLDKLIAIIKEKLKTDFTKKEYVDLRYGDKVYYK